MRGVASCVPGNYFIFVKELKMMILQYSLQKFGEVFLR